MHSSFVRPSRQFEFVRLVIWSFPVSSSGHFPAGHLVNSNRVLSSFPYWVIEDLSSCGVQRVNRKTEQSEHVRHLITECTLGTVSTVSTLGSEHLSSRAPEHRD